MPVHSWSLLTLKLDLILDNEGLILVIDFLGEFGRDSMVSGRVLDNEALVALDALVLDGLLDSPFSNVRPLLLLLVGAGRVLLRVRRLPALLPVIGELLQEVGLERSGLRDARLAVNGT